MEGHKKNIRVAGVDIEKAETILLMLHGRGGTAEDIISFTHHLKTTAATHIIAPQATNNSWYPNSFLAPVEKNQPWLNSALDLLGGIMADTEAKGLNSKQVYIIGFSQGACLSLEFAARNPKKYGGVIAFTGGLIGEVLIIENYCGDFEKTKIFIGNSDRDPHVPLKRSEESKSIMENLGADVALKVYPGMGHTINQDEIEWVNKIVLK
ncbi:dienelactone hydrolase family protein [Ferruginibacter paludis]|uniref:alpha/beta hydrolase n=1 Tax=Ferruginibacter paludis TaxID=1310417 RepID=UPI0025B4DF01|nr:dienelactone hydrolase family protein [Ferruginibacter paludis]MDN3656082.1 dienelactone hydrolase family protein [Ferruginibacter paludis]